MNNLIMNLNKLIMFIFQYFAVTPVKANLNLRVGTGLFVGLGHVITHLKM